MTTESVERKWMIFENTIYHWFSVVAVRNGWPEPMHSLGDFESREQVELFIADLRAAADRVFGREEA